MANPLPIQQIDYTQLQLQLDALIAEQALINHNYVVRITALQEKIATKPSE
jgi:hypothetical protein